MASERPSASDLLSALRSVGAVSLLGRGGQKSALMCEDGSVLKVVDQPEFDVERLNRELAIMTALSHPSIVNVIDGPRLVGVGGVELLAWTEPFYPGGSLTEQMGAKHPVEAVIHRLLRILDALKLLEEKGLVHRDIKPGNLMVDENGLEVLIDFGLVLEISGTRITRTGTNAGGTNGYAPLEMYEPKVGGSLAVDSRTDQFSLGVVAYRLLTGGWPFGEPGTQGFEVNMVSGAVNTEALLEMNCPAGLVQILVKTLQPKRHGRFRHVKDLASALEGVL